VVVAAHERDRVVGAINQTVVQARANDVPVVWVQHNDADLPTGTDGWKIVPELVPEDSEPIVHKSCRDAFENTSLEQELADRGVGKLVVTGAQTDFCVRWTLHGALTRGYDTVLVGDAHTTDVDSPDGMPSGSEIIAHTNSIWASQAVPNCSTSVVEAAALQF